MGMLIALFHTEFRRHMPIFAGLSLFSAAFSLLFSLRGEDEVYAVLALLLRSGLGVFIPWYIWRELKKSFFDRSDLLPLLLPIQSSTRLFIQTAVLGSWTMLLWAANQLEIFLNPLGLYAARIAHSAQPELGLLYLLVGKGSAVLCEIALIILGIAISLTVAKCRRLAIAIQVSLLPLIVMLLFITMSTYVPQFSAWMIGSTSTISYPQYAGLLSVNFENIAAYTDIAETIHWNSVLLNLLTACIAFAISFPLLNSSRLEAKGEQNHA